MATRYAPPTPIFSLGIQDARWLLDNLDDTVSSYTEHLPRAGGQAAPTNPNAKLGLEVLGYQSEGLDLVVSHAGMPGVAGARVKYRPAGGADSTLRGWCPPNFAADWVAAVYASAGVATYSIPDAVVVPSTQEVVVIYARTDAGHQHYTQRFSVVDWDWGAAVTAASTSVPTRHAAAITVIPDSERLLAWTGRTSLIYSDDYGDTWADYASGALPANVAGGSGTPLRSRLHYLQGDLSLVLVQTVGGFTRLYQYASDSLGTSFELVNDWLSPGGTPDVIPLQSGRLLCVRLDGGVPKARTVGSAWEALEDAQDVTIDAGAALSELALAQDWDGAIYVYGRDTMAPNGMSVWRSLDDGLTWEAFDFGAVNTGDASTYLRDMTAVCFAGYAGLLHQWEASIGDEEDSVAMLILGGWGTVHPASLGLGTSSDDLDLKRHAWGATAVVGGGDWYTWAPYDLPSDIAAYTVGGATGTETLTGGRLGLATVAQQQWYYIDTSTDANVSWMGVVRADFGGSLGQTDIGVQLEYATGAVTRTVAVNVTTTAIEVYDVQAATQRAVVSGLTASQWWEVWAAINNTRGRVWYRAPGDPAWTLLWDGLLTDGGAGPANGQIRFGCGVDGIAVAVASWRFWGLGSSTGNRVWASDSVTTGATTQVAVGKGIADPAYPLSDLAVYDWDEDGSTESLATWLRATTGPGATGEVYEAPTAADHPLSTLFVAVSPGPDEDWQSADDGSDVVICLDIPQAALDTWLGSSSLMIALLGANFRTATLEAEEHGGAGYTTLATIDLATGFTGLAFTRNGDRVVPTAGTVDAGRVTRRHEHVGATMELDDGAGAVVLRRVMAHTEGWWTDETTRQSRYVLGGVDPADPTSGTCEVWAHSGVHIQHGLHSADLYRRWALRIPAQDTVDGRFRLGALMVCALQPIGKAPGPGTARDGRLNVETSRDRYGVPRRRALGPRVRSWTLPWQQGAVRGRYEHDPEEAEYIAPTGAGGDPLALRDDVYALLDGVTRDLDEGALPAILLMVTPSSSLTVTDPMLWAYGQLVTGAASTHVAGYESDDYRRIFERIDAIEFQEIPYAGPR